MFARYQTLLLLLLGSAACTTNYKPGPAGVVRSATILPVHPDRPRISYREPRLTERIHARRLDLQLLDNRTPVRHDEPGSPVLADPTGERPIPVSVHRDFDDTLKLRLLALADGAADAPVVTVLVLVEQADAWRGKDHRTIEVKLRFGLQTDQGTVLGSAETEATGRIDDAPYDLTELDQLHLFTFLTTFDRAFSAENVIKMNESLRESPLPELTWWRG